MKKKHWPTFTALSLLMSMLTLFPQNADALTDKEWLEKNIEKCEAGSGKSCAFAGGMYSDGEGTAKSVEAAGVYYLKACLLGVSYACSNVAYGLSKGKLGFEENDELALMFRERACERLGLDELDEMDELDPDMMRTCSFATLILSGQKNPRHIDNFDIKKVLKYRNIKISLSACDKGNGVQCTAAVWQLSTTAGFSEREGHYEHLYNFLRVKCLQESGFSHFKSCETVLEHLLPTESGGSYEKGRYLLHDDQLKARLPMVEKIKQRVCKVPDAPEWSCAKAEAALKSVRSQLAD